MQRYGKNPFFVVHFRQLLFSSCNYIPNPLFTQVEFPACHGIRQHNGMALFQQLIISLSYRFISSLNINHSSVFFRYPCATFAQGLWGSHELRERVGRAEVAVTQWSSSSIHCDLLTERERNLCATPLAFRLPPLNSKL